MGKSDLTSKVLVDGHFKYGSEKRSIRSTIVAYRSDEQQKFVQESEEWKACSEDEKEGRKLSAPCRAARNMASSLDKVHAKLSLPKEISENRFVEMATEAAKIFFLPYSSHKYLEGKTYRYTVNDCEHIIFAEESSRPRIFVSNKKTPSKHFVSMVVDGEKFEVEIPRETRHTQRQQATLKVNNQVQQ